MDYKDQKDISSLESNNGNSPNEYKLLVQKLKSIKSIINKLEKNFLDREI